MGAPKGSRRNPDGRAKSDVIRLTKAARERFDRQLAENLDDVFKAILEVGTKDKDTAALSLLVNRAVPIRRGATVTFTARTLTTPHDCAAAFGDLLAAIGKGELTPDEGNQIGALIERRANLFHTVELQDEIAALKAQMLALAPRPQSILPAVDCSPTRTTRLSAQSNPSRGGAINMEVRRLWVFAPSSSCRSACSKATNSAKGTEKPRQLRHRASWSA